MAERNTFPSGSPTSVGFGLAIIPDLKYFNTMSAVLMWLIFILTYLLINKIFLLPINIGKFYIVLTKNTNLSVCTVIN